jgi:hypothetical protein
LNERAFPIFDTAALLRFICASKRIDTARPAASSSGFTIFEPEESRASDFCSDDVDSARRRAPFAADMLVFITILDSFHESPFLGDKWHPCHSGEIFSEALTVFLVGSFWLPTADLSTTFYIGEFSLIFRKLN